MRDTSLEGWFDEPGAYVLVDGQFGSTGKGLLAGYLADAFGSQITHVTTNAGPNSGHTAYFQPTSITGEEKSHQKIMTQQIPVASAFLRRRGWEVITLLNAGAVIDPVILAAEAKEHFPTQVNRHLFIHPCAALIGPEHIITDNEILSRVAGTGKGVGPALAGKVLRLSDAVARELYMPMMPYDYHEWQTWDRFWNWQKDRVFVETAQGFSLGLNTARFYPHVTSRECTVMQAIADARIPAQMVKKVIMTLRTYPIRVGNTQGSSGDPYPDQYELEWSQIGVEPELTTVTKRVRRVFSWSRIQFRDAVAANRPDALFLNFCNYLNNADLFTKWIPQILEDYEIVMGREPEDILLGFGPYGSDIKIFE